MARQAGRNAKGGGMIRKRADGLWEARYTSGYDLGTGKQIQKSVYAKTQADVRKKLTEKINQIDKGVYTEPVKMTVACWLNIWLEEYVRDTVKPFTYSSYHSQCQNHINPALGAVRLSELTTPAIQHFYNTLKRGTVDKKGLSPKSIKNVHGVLHSALRKAVALRYIPYNPSDACEFPRVKRKEIKPLDEKQIVLFLKAIKGDQYEILYKITLFSGLRQGEVLGLRWDDVDLNTGYITVKTQLQKEKKKGGAYYLADPKSNKSRVIMPAPYVMSLLRRQRAEQSRAKLSAGEMWNNPWNLVFTNELGGHLVAVTVYKHFKEKVHEIGLPKARFHDLRHSYAVAALQSGDDIKTVQSNLGHQTAAFTLDVYGHVTDKMKKQSSERMEAFIQDIEDNC